MPEFSVSTWSLHRALGAMYQPAADGSGKLESSEPWGPGSWTLLEVPAELAKRGISNLEICHFHFPRADDDYLDALKNALNASGIVLFSVLIDAGDISNPDPARREADLAWIRGWIDVAGRLGSKNVRVIAGDAKPDDPEGLRRSVEAMRELSNYARERGVRVMTENFHALTSRPDTLNVLLDRLDGEVGLCGDFGNYGGDTKYADLAAILSRADSVHAKAHFNEDGTMEREDFNRCLELAKTANFSGPYTLIFEGPQSEWEGISLIQSEIRSAFS
jgi:sugar phosphate isomerase/epimerase